MTTDQRWGEGGASARALECVAAVLDVAGAPDDRTRGLLVLCRFGAEVVAAGSVGHVRCDRAGAATQVCVWRADGPGLTSWEERAGTYGPADWWTSSPARRRLYDALDSEHLAELPLRTDEEAPSLLVLAREVPFGDPEADRLTRARSSMLLLERLVDVLLPPASGPTTGVRAEAGTGVVGALLTSREREVLALLGHGLLARSIAARLDVSERTVHKHLGSIYRKLDAHDRLLAVRRGEELGLIAPAQEGLAAAGW